MSKQTVHSIFIAVLTALSLASACLIVTRNNAAMHGTVTAAPSGFMH